MELPRELQADCAFRHGAHTVRLALTPSALDVEVEAHVTADRWRGSFDASFIEDLTHKTGNFKQFDIFCSMLESALTKSSTSVTLDLLTYTDLEILHSRKLGASARPPTSATSPLSTKRYLILVYSVEFDRIHYPLPLLYAGQPDPATLCAALRELQEELQQLRTRCYCAGSDERRDCSTIRHLRMELQRVQEEKQAAQLALRALRQDKGAAGSVPALQRALGRLEEQLKLERSRHQRQQQQLSEELSQAKASQRRLQQRVTALTAELGACRRGAPRSLERPSPSSSRDRRGSSRSRPPTRSPSPAAPRPPRFDPTAFVRARQRRQQEVEQQKQRRRGAQGSSSPARSQGRSNSAESFRSRRSGFSSNSDTEGNPQHPQTRGRKTTRSRRPPSSSSCNSLSGGSHPAASSNRSRKVAQYEEPLAEIDARLRALQTYMDSLGT